MYLHNQTPFNASRIDCLVDWKGTGIESVIVSNCSQPTETLYDFFVLCSKKEVKSVVIELGTDRQNMYVQILS